LFLTDWVAGIRGADARTILLFLGLRVMLSLVITWVLDRTDESLPLATVVHASDDTFVSLLLVATFTTLDATRDALTGAVIGHAEFALVLVVLARGRPGHRPEPHAD
jgi:uncharacterized protein